MYAHWPLRFLAITNCGSAGGAVAAELRITASAAPGMACGPMRTL
jgi:hypothetical protein